jgi:hypothetical protein
MDYRAGQGAGSAAHGLNARDPKLAELVKSGCLDSGDAVVGIGRSSAHCTQPIALSPERPRPTDLDLDEHVGPEHPH